MSNVSNEEYKVISRFIFDPSRTIFKQVANSKAKCTTIRCKLDKCPLRSKDQCIFANMFSTHRCPYGKLSIETGYTKRARAFYRWIDKKKKEYPNTPSLNSSSTNKLAFISDYIYLPYAHMDMNKALPFLSHSIPFVGGNPFLPRSTWSIDTVLSIVDFKPQAMFGGEITSYQKESIPTFLNHLKENDKKMWNRLIKKRPKLDKEPNHVGRMAILLTLNYPITWTTNNKYPVVWEWNGEYLKTNSIHAYNSTWGEIKLQSISLESIPSKDTTIKVKDNSWVNNKTKFVD
ncbi:MAG: hypothetical protein ACTSW7_00545 [Candidatus Thorarchaeota archaeon]|nr:MAG: hypothetical protein DRP42_02805 [Mycoplasmatota bacterium]HEC72610.1 hypothetical protein [Thermoplasmatales archaeon]